MVTVTAYTGLCECGRCGRMHRPLGRPPHGREQKLVDIMFEIAIMAAERMHGEDKEAIAHWVANALRDAGINTHPQGSSWGVLE